MIGKKEFIAIAEQLNDHSMIDDKDQMITVNESAFYICLDLANLFAQLNPRFEHNKFMTACGFSAKKINELLVGVKGETR